MFTLLAVSALLGISSFCVGVIPLSFSLSKTHLTRLSNLGTGLLLGTALGVIIPEGVETIALAHTLSDDLPTTRIGLALLSGFTLMIILEQLISPNSHWHGQDVPLHIETPAFPMTATSVEFDAELGELENEQSFANANGGRRPPVSIMSPEDELRAIRARSYPLTVGLSLHAVTDGVALGVAFFLKKGALTHLSLVMLFAIAVHKAPTALALTSSLLANGLPRQDCKRHLAMFCASTPIASLATSIALMFLYVRSEELWVGTCLLISGGTFLYVATVLQPVAQNPEPHGNAVRVSLIIVGIVVPFITNIILGDH